MQTYVQLINGRVAIITVTHKKSYQKKESETKKRNREKRVQVLVLNKQTNKSNTCIKQENRVENKEKRRREKGRE